MERVDVCKQVLTTLTQRAFKSTSPLDQRATLKFILQLDGGEEGLAMLAEARRKGRGVRSPANSIPDLKEDRTQYGITRAHSAGSLARNSLNSKLTSTHNVVCIYIQ